MNQEKKLKVLKFGGASVATPESFHRIAEIVKGWSAEKVVVVISAMGDTTDRLLALAKEVHPEPPRREQDMLVSVGERISMALLAMALLRVGVDAVSFTGSQSGIITDEQHAEARILEVRPKRIVEALEAGKVAIVAGFQGVSRKGEITTLGRGGSDTTAVALAIALGAKGVDFYKDVPGIYSADPKKDPNAILLSRLSFAAAKQMQAKILHVRSIALAEKNGIQLQVRPFMQPDCVGTVVGEAENQKRGVEFEGS